MSEIHGQIKAVNGKTTPTGKTVYEIEFSDGKTYATFKQDVAVEARAAIGSSVTAEVSEQQKGQYTNYYWNGITAKTADPAPVVQWIPGQIQAPAPSDKDAQIARAVALKAAVDLVANGTPSPELVLEVAAQLEPYLTGKAAAGVSSAGTPWDQS